LGWKMSTGQVQWCSADGE